MPVGEKWYLILVLNFIYLIIIFRVKKIFGWIYFWNSFQSSFELMWTIKTSIYCICLEHLKSTALPLNQQCSILAALLKHLECFLKILLPGPHPRPIMSESWGLGPALIFFFFCKTFIKFIIPREIWLRNNQLNETTYH